MDLTQQSITGRQFELNRRGYDPDAVDAHLADIASAVAARESTIAELEASIGPLEARVRDADESEEALRLTLKAAARAKEELLTGAREQAKTIEAEAAAKAELLVAEATSEADDSIAAASASVAAMEDGARQQAGDVARAALAESEALVARIEEMRERLDSAEDALAALRSDSAPQIEAARGALESALEKAREGVDNPEILAALAAESAARNQPEPAVAASEAEGVDTKTAEHAHETQPAEAAVPTSETAPEVEIDASSMPEMDAVDAEAGDTVEMVDEEDVDQPERHLEVVEAAESTSDISDKVDRLLEELREVT